MDYDYDSDSSGYDSYSDDEEQAQREAAIQEQLKRQNINPFLQFKQFNVYVDIMQESYSKRFTKRFDEMPRLDQLKADKPIEHNRIHGILTGAQSGITVVDIKEGVRFRREMIDTDLYNTTLYVSTPNQGAHFYFKYDSRLKSIYETMKGVSILNDDRFVLAGGNYYRPANNDADIKPMPQAMFDKLYAAQINPDLVHQECDTLFSILTDDYFKEHRMLKQLICVLKNAGASNAMITATLRKSITSRFGWYNQFALEDLIIAEPNYVESRYNLKAFKRHMESAFGDTYRALHVDDTDRNNEPSMSRLKYQS
ncbi:hypothetical protein PPTG_23627 [Phytophthora nicotianae INRA-310]|uniref:DNA primase/polymerase bifunctional N-terminal domain-containing protein n=2 Tax=Phytophthora nicotianae TaxID=4792 RepID=W2PVA1_PHYN3|nr:hypothetical protein PPTG_23627 [Phytophthora nicotianae INRA-310]ETN04154.1 hypothetical protein PPTG_23627 [Phytophthora nicotianae INRA-310]